jgi:DNA polymerase III subunit delta'
VSFAEIQHQDRAVGELQSVLAADRVPHGFIFCGPAGVGKALTARALAATLLCDAPKKGRGKRPALGPCGTCDQCRLSGRDNHPDLSWFRKPSGSAVFPIDVVTRRDKSPDGPTINESAQLTPMQARCRVTIIEDAELMNAAAANAFLKTFEEAPDGAYLVLLVTSLDRLLPTIRSRGRLIRFGALPSAFIAELLKRDGAMSAGDAATLSRFAEGSMDLAAALARSEFLQLHREVLDALPAMDRGGALALADALAAWATEQADNEAQLEVDDTASSKEKKRQVTVERNTLRRTYLKRSLGMLASVFRDALLAKSGAGDGLQNVSARTLIEHYAGALPMATLERGVGRFLTYQTYVDRNVHVQLLMENACLELADLLAPARR